MPNKFLLALMLALVPLSLFAQTLPNDLSANDKDFIEYAGEFDLTQTQLGKVAEQKASNSVVKHLATKLASEHAQSLKSLTALANKVGGIAPNSLDEPHREAIRQLNKATGSNFDKQLLQLIINEHQTALTSFSRESEQGSTQALRAFATKVLPSIKRHLEQAQSLADTMR